MMSLIVLCSFWLHFSKPFMLLVRRNPTKNWKNDCLHLTIISNKMRNILEVSQFCYSGRGKKKQECLFFQVEHLRVWFFIQTKLLLPNFKCVQKARTIPDKKNHTAPRLSPITSSLSPNFSLPFFSLFWMRIYCPASIKFTQTTRMAGLPMKIFIFPLPPSIMKLLKAAQVYRCYSWSLKLVEHAHLRCNCALKYKDKPNVNFPPPPSHHYRDFLLPFSLPSLVCAW